MTCGRPRMPINMDVMGPMEENYDPNKPVCDNQDTFSQAFRKAIKYNDKENLKKAKPWVYIYLVLWIVFFVWAILLAMQVPSGPDRVEHIVFAMVLGPVYVLAYYLGAYNGSMFGMCGGNRY